MTYFDDQLLKLQQQTARKKQLEAMLADLRNQFDSLCRQASELHSAYSKEQEDVQRLEGRSLAAFFYHIVGKKEEALDRERVEAYAAKVKYDAALAARNAAEQDIAKCKAELAELTGCEAEYAQLLGEKAESIKSSGSADGAEILRLESQMADMESKKKELREAVFAGNDALKKVNQILKSLNDAEGWGTWDLLGGGLISDIAKHSALDEAQRDIEQLQILLQRFQTELADVTVRANIRVSVDGFLHFADFFFDGLFADWAVMERIKDSQTQVQNTKRQIEQVLRQLEGMLQSAESELTQTKAKLDELVLRAQV